MSTVDDLYASEINAKIEWLWDGGIDAWIGDSMNGWLDATTVATWSDVEQWLEQAAINHYPQSKFALSRAAAKPDGETL